VLLLSRHSLTQDEFQRLSDAVYHHCGINLHQGKQYGSLTSISKIGDNQWLIRFAN
jgi:hypothetical protein